MTGGRQGGGWLTSMKLEDIVIKLQMAYLYICKKGENSVPGVCVSAAGGNRRFGTGNH